MKHIDKLAAQAHKSAVNRDAYGVDPVGSIIDKIQEELTEFETAIISGDKANLPRYRIAVRSGMSEKSAFEKYIKDTPPDELADVIITALAASIELGYDIYSHIELKMKYNEIRDK